MAIYRGSYNTDNNHTACARFHVGISLQNHLLKVHTKAGAWKTKNKLWHDLKYFKMPLLWCVTVIACDGRRPKWWNKNLPNIPAIKPPQYSGKKTSPISRQGDAFFRVIRGFRWGCIPEQVRADLCLWSAFLDNFVRTWGGIEQIWWSTL